MFEVMEHRKTKEKNAEGQEKEEPRKGKHLSFGLRASLYPNNNLRENKQIHL
jgi:hypothetical protein